MIKFSNMINENNSEKFKISIDVHGVIDSIPDTFSFLSNAIVNAGGELHIITGASWNKELESQLKSFGVRWTHHFSVYDELIKRDTKVVGELQFPDGTIQKKFENGSWDQVKGEYCFENSINLHIDDTLIYNNFFKTPFARLWSNNGKPKSDKKDIRHLD